MKKPGHLTQKTETNARVFATNTPDGLFRGLPSFDLMWRGLDGVAAIFYAIFSEQRNASASARVIVRRGEKCVRMFRW